MAKDRIDKKARDACINQRCYICKFVSICTPFISEVCATAYKKGYKRGYKQRKTEEKCNLI